MTSTPRDVGTLIVVVLKAKNLPNKRHIGKQDPFCTVTYNGEKRRTKAIHRGGQHPEWDEEIRFTLFEDTENDATNAANGGTPPPPPPKANGKGPPKIKGGKSMIISCYAEDPREPDLIGETTVDLTEVLTKGETDEWFTIMNKEKYCGEVYLELTFWSNEPPPVKKVRAKPKAHRQYGGPGSFVPTEESTEEVRHAISHLPSTSSFREELSRDSIPSSLRSSSSIANLDLYVPAYESTRSHHSVDSVVNEFAELGFSDNVNRRQSFPPQQGYLPTHGSFIEYPDSQALSPLSSQGYRHSTYSDGGYSYERPVTPSGSLPYHHSSMSINHEPYQAPYESTPPPQPSYQAPVRHAGPRYSMPTSSSGFMPVSTPAPSGFLPLSSHVSQPSGFTPLPAPTPAPMGYGPPPSHVPVPSSSFSTLPLSLVPPPSFGVVPSASPAPYHQHTLPQPPPGHSYPQYPPPMPSSSFQHYPLPALTTSAPPLSQTAPQKAYGPPAPVSVPVQSQSAPPPDRQSMQMSIPPPPHDHIPPPPPLNESPSSGQVSNSRPLPQPRRRNSSLPVPPMAYPQYVPTAGGNVHMPPSVSYNHIPPPPPLPQHSAAASTYSQTPHPTIPVPPPPAPSSVQSRPTRRPSLPAPPHSDYQQQSQSAFQALPPPPPPPTLPAHAIYEQVMPFPVPSQSQTFYPGPPPRPPVQLQSQSQYLPPTGGPPSAHAGYSSPLTG
ncbi:predicted protein [Sparassis crispa]|uniref:C2 domain-containing protein n=1 Tax=Sparassis crispa TaxID=139825 RepID=A0A401GAV7_9APHY|nr:predicted protein [Sparassis crispa]GBE79289.1 predicted protein [Sparassis crispa]